MAQVSVIKKLSWRLKELPPATGLSMAFWRKAVLHRKVRARKVGGAVVILDSDLQEFLKGKEEGGESEPTTANQ